jgi:DNA repair exonuclease SbcCD ATPase subunit
MKIEKITLCAFRGYPEETSFEFGGSNALIYGGNGTGKSSLLEAIEYLLTGRIHRLHGHSTAGITKKQHYPTRGCDPDDTFVEAEFITEDGTKVAARREFTGGLKTDPTPPPEGFGDLQQLAENQLHKLTRADLVNLVHATPSDRGDRINSLLGVEPINQRRKQLRRLEKNRFGRKLRNTRSQLEERKRELKRRLGVSELEENELLEAVNTARRDLGGEPLSELGDWSDLDFRDDLTGPAAQKLSVFHREDVPKQIGDLEEWAKEIEPALGEKLEEIDRLVRAITADEASGELDHLQILEQGSDLIDHQTTQCPLCGEKWDSEELHEHVERRREELDRIARRRDDLNTIQAEVDDRISEFTNKGNQLISIIREEADSEVVSSLERYIERLEQLADDVAMADDIEADPEFVGRFESLPLEGAKQALERLSEHIPEEPNQSELESAWQKLKDTERDLREISSLREDVALAEECRDVCREMKRSLITARDDAVDAVHRRIEKSFSELYGAINPDEEDIDVQLNQTDAGVSFRVGFFGDDVHPAQALHSEGHQDLMGLCLFMALSRETSTARQRYIMLDDVVMSVDREHLREIANILESTVGQEFQVIITTHDEEWEGILGLTDTVPVDNQVTLQNWNQDSGPDIV